MPDASRIAELRRRVAADPASIAFAALAEELRRAGRFREAVAVCRAGLERHPAYLSAHVTLGRSLIELGQFDEAQQELTHVLGIAPENLAATRGLAEIRNRTGDAGQDHPDAAQYASERFGAPAGSNETAYPNEAPALAGLEEFLNAIKRARSERAAGR